MIEMTVDPGVNTGIAVWKSRESPVCGWELICSAVIRTYEKDTDIQLRQIFDLFLDQINLHKPSHVTLEGIQDFGTMKSQVAFRRGNLSKVSYIVGGLFALCTTQGITCNIVLPSQWKGQMNDKVLARRVERLMGQTYRDHELQAVGIGLHKQGVL